MNTKVFVRRINKCLELMMVLSVTSRGKVVIGDKSTFIHMCKDIVKLNIYKLPTFIHAHLHIGKY